LKMFHSEIQNDHAAIKKEEANYQPIPQIANVTEQDVQENYKKIKKDIQLLVAAELNKLEAPEKPVVEKQKPVRKRALRPSVSPARKTKKSKVKDQEQTISM
jgi:aromatic ring hydroxylase